MLSSLPIDELRNGALGMVELLYEACTERAGIHDNPESGNHLALSH